MEDLLNQHLAGDELKEMIYDLMIGAYDVKRFHFPLAEFIEDEYATGKECDKLYGEIYRANRRVCKRLGVDEDSDVELIIGNMDSICRILAYKMFDYGTKKDTLQEKS